VTMPYMLIGDTALRWIVTMFFGVSIATYAYILVAQRSRWTSTVNHLLHLTMSAAMILMTWRVGMHFPTAVPTTATLLAGAWFAVRAGRRSSATGDRLSNGYTAVMTGAMAWMYAFMNGSLPGQARHSHDSALSSSLAMEMPRMEMPAHPMSHALAGPDWIIAVNCIATLAFAVMALYWLCDYFAERRRNLEPSAAQRTHLQPLYQAFTAAGTAVMFGVML